MVALLETGEVEELSLDHDLALWDENGREITGDDVVSWLMEAVVMRSFVPPRRSSCTVGTPPDADRMELGIETIYRRHEEQRR